MAGSTVGGLDTVKQTCLCVHSHSTLLHERQPCPPMHICGQADSMSGTCTEILKWILSSRMALYGQMRP